MAGNVQHEGAFSDPRISADQHHRAGNDAAAENAVELLDRDLDPGELAGLDPRQRHGRRARQARHSAARRLGRLDRLREAVPRAAVGTAPRPAVALPATLLADEYDPRLPRHRSLTSLGRTAVPHKCSTRETSV